MATFVWTGNTSATWSTGSNWSVGGVAQASPPGSTDDVSVGSGTGATNNPITLTSGTTVRTVDFTGYTATFTHNSNVTLNFGGHLIFSEGMTYTFGSTNNSMIVGVASSTNGGVGWTINTAGKTLGSFTPAFNTAGLWQISSDVTCAGQFEHRNGRVNYNNFTITCGNYQGSTTNGNRTFDWGTCTIVVTSSAFNIGGNGTTILANTATVRFITTTSASFTIASANTLNLQGISIEFNNPTTATFNCAVGGPSGITSVTRNGTAAKTDTLVLGGGTILSCGTLNINSHSIVNRVMITSNGMGSPRSIVAGAVNVTNGSNWRDITLTGAAAPLDLTGGENGDCLGNTGIMLPAPKVRYAVNALGVGNRGLDSTDRWSVSSGGASGASVPLPQDDVIFDAGSGSGTYEQAMPHCWANADFTGFTGVMQWLTQSSWYGSCTLGSGMALANSGMQIFSGRGAHTITSNGKNIVCTVTLDCATGSYALLDSFNNSNNAFVRTSGSFYTGGFALASFNFIMTTAATGTVDFSTSTVTANGTSSSQGFNCTSVGTTFITDQATFALSSNAGNSKVWNFQPGQQVGAIAYTGAGAGTAASKTRVQTSFTVLNSISANGGNIKIDAGQTLTMGDSCVMTFTGGAFLLCQTAASTAFIAKSGGPNVVNATTGTIQDVHASVMPLYAPDAVNGGNTTGWVFDDPPTIVPSSNLLMMGV